AGAITTTGGPFTFGTLNLTGQQITLSQSVTSTGNMTLSASNGNTSISQSGTAIVSSPNLTLTLNSASGIANLNTAANVISLINGSGTSGSSITVNNGTNPLALGSFSGGQNLTVGTSGG